MKNLRGLMSMVKEATSREPEIEIRLTTLSSIAKARVRYNFHTSQYECPPDEELVENLLTLPSRTILKEEAQRIQEESKLNETAPSLERSESKTVTKEDDFDGIISKEELRKLDSQPNPFNFSDRVSQTTKFVTKDVGAQTDPPPGTCFGASVGLGEIFDAYQRDYEERLLQEAEQEDGPAAIPKVFLVDLDEDAEGGTAAFGEETLLLPDDLVRLARRTAALERMVSQNIYDEITQDFKYWEDESDEFQPLEGSLLPLWKFSCDNSKSFSVSCVSWSPVYSDLFAAAYRSDDSNDEERGGMICLFTLKNPLAPERMLKTSVGVTTMAFHPWLQSVLLAGRTDGNVAIFDVRCASSPIAITSSAVSGKHAMIVRQVHWIRTDSGENLCFFSVSTDGRVTQWHLHSGALIHTDLLNFNQQGPSTSRGTCIAFKPDDESVLLIGCDTGAVFQCTTEVTTHALTKYDAHFASVGAIKWNLFNSKVFLTCSIDWTVKLWLEHFLSPLVVLDVGGPVAGVCWSPSSSTVLVATTDEGKIHVFDLFLRKCRPLCVQNAAQKRRLAITALDFSPYFPVILVGGKKGHLVALKLSPNLRKLHKDAKGGDDQRQREVEIAKMERLIAISKAQI